ncbi:MAG: NADH-quinone oxidoreductase subunit NuoF [Caldilineaceae bacterium]|nr:NADH-quinone oxidoreductase subunit NuoF [Caldilineaceae bacterium]
MILSESVRAEIRKWMDLYPAGRQRSAILPALYVIQREFGYCKVEAQNELAEMLELEPAEVGAVVGFYNMFHEEPKGDYHIEVCTNVPCMLRGSSECMHHLEDQLGIHHGEQTADTKFALDHMECLGSCGTAPMVSITETKSGKIRYFEELDSAEDVAKMINLVNQGKAFETLERWTPEGDPQGEGKAAGPYRHGGMEQLYLLARAAKPNSHTLETFEADGGYGAAKRVLTEMKPEEVLEQVKASGIRGRGGAGFPTGTKWSFLAPAFPRYLVVNADESEPGTFKDRMVMEYDPHQLIEGIILSSFAIQAEKAFIYIRGEYYFAYTRLVGAIQEAKAKGYLGQGIFGTDKNLEIVVHRGAGAYECGEETALLSSLEGYRGHPRMKPPFPAVEGLYAKPTIVNNVESICNVTQVMRHGVDWYKGFGTEKSPGMRIFCLSGNVKYPGLYELPHAVPLRELIYTHGGGPQDENAPLKAIVPGGLSMKLLTMDQIDTALDYESVAAAGSLLGSAGVIAIDERTSMVEVARRTLSFYREESCGKCTPCREGTGWLETILMRIEAGGGRDKDLELMEHVSRFIAGKSFCPFGDAAVWGLQSNLAKFRNEFITHIDETNPQDIGPLLPIRPIYRPDTGSASVLRDSAIPPIGDMPLNRDHVAGNGTRQGTRTPHDEGNR